MRKAFGTIAATTGLLALSHEAAARSWVNDSPFVGEHHNARTIKHESGRVSAKMETVQTSYNKYESLMVRDGLFESRTAKQQKKQSSWSDYLFGKSNSESSAYSGRSHRLGADITQELVNNDGTMWVGPVYMGGSYLMDVVYDTGSDWLVVEGSNCSNCEGNTYNVNDSEGSPSQVNASQSQRNYGSASLTGYEYIDKVCIALNICINSFEFFLIDSQVGIAEPIDGILGMSRNAPFYIAGDNQNTSGPLFTENLFKDGAIGADKFSFYFQLPGQQSWVDFGEPELSYKKSGTDWVTTKMIDNDFFWANYNTGVAIGSIANAFAYEQSPDYPVFIENNAIYSVIDTGSTALMISALYYEALIYEIFNYAGDSDWQFVQGGYVECSCNANLPPIWFQYDSYWIEVRATDYIWDYFGTDRCILFVLPTNMPMHILGMPLFIDYYTIHDAETGEMTWAPHTNSPKETMSSGPVPTGKYLAIGAIEQQSATDLLLEYAAAAVACYAAIYYWQTDVYPSLILESNGYTEQQVLGLSGGYFLAFALAYYYALQPVVDEIFDTSSSSSTASAGFKTTTVMVGGQEVSAMTIKVAYAAMALVASYLILKTLKSKNRTAAVQQEKKEKKQVTENSMDELLNRLE